MLYRLLEPRPREYLYDPSPEELVYALLTNGCTVEQSCLDCAANLQDYRDECLLNLFYSVAYRLKILVKVTK